VIRTARSLLFVPGNRPERFAKAEAAGADLVCIDLEDAVPPDQRAAARQAVLEHLRRLPAGHRTGVRISGLGSADGLHDVLALAQTRAHAQAEAAPRPAPAFVMLAKAEHAEQIVLLAGHLSGLPLIALIESARGLHQAAAMAGAHPQLQALMFGGADLAADLGCALAWEPLLHARCALVAAAASQGLGLLDVPWLDVSDSAGAQAETARVAGLGFSGKACIHPVQVALVHAALLPCPEAVARARRVLAATGDAAADTAAVLVDGRLVDRPVVLAAQRLLARAGV
jgi:citrate lyase beta subunit